jgi:hypothetical protein
MAALSKHFAKNDPIQPLDWLASKVMDAAQRLSWQNKKVTAYAVSQLINEQIGNAQGFSEAKEKATLAATMKRLSPRMREMFVNAIKSKRAEFFRGGDPDRGPYDESQIRVVMKSIGLIFDARRKRTKRILNRF